MARLALKDRAQDQIATALTASATSLVLNDVTEFGSSYLTPPFLVIVDSGNTKEEIMMVTAVNEVTKTLTVVRGVFGTTGVAHSIRALVVHTGTPVVITARIVDVGTAETLYLMPPKCVVVQAFTVLGAAITLVDSVVTLYNKTTALTGGVITIANAASAAGDIDSCNPTAYNEFDGVDDYLKVINGGESTGVAPALLTIIAMAP